jgi:hypothetical protein
MGFVSGEQRRGALGARSLQEQEVGMLSSLRSAASQLSDADLVRRVPVLAGREREATVELVAHLAELDGRRLYLGQGHGSLFSYCTRELRLAEHSAYNRIEAARASRRFPVLLDLLADGSLTLSAVRLLSPHLGPDNFDALVALAKGKSKREVEVLVARLAPRPDVAASVRRLPARPPAGPHQPSPVTADPPATRSMPCSASSSLRGVALPAGGLRAASAPADAEAAQQATGNPIAPETGLPIGSPPAPAPPVARAVVAPLAPGRYRVQFTVGEATHDKLRQVQDLLRREIPNGDPAAIFDRALTLLLEVVARKRLAATRQLRHGAAGVGSAGAAGAETGVATARAAEPVPSIKTRTRHIPARVKRAVWLRDGGRCAQVSPGGHRCEERAFLEFHHRDPHALGGEPTLGNIALRCRRHNAYEAYLIFGEWTRPDSPPGRVGHRPWGSRPLAGATGTHGVRSFGSHTL